VKEAEAAAVKRLLAKYPGLKASDLTIDVSKKVKADDARRRKLWAHPELLFEDGYIEGENPAGLVFRNRLPPAVNLDQDLRLAERLYLQDLAAMDAALMANGRNGFSRNAAMNMHLPGPSRPHPARRMPGFGYGGIGYPGRVYGGIGPFL